MKASTRLSGRLRTRPPESQRVPIQMPADEHNAAYLKTKRDKLGHLLDDDQGP
jgi:hypothetical protein